MARRPRTHQGPGWLQPGSLYHVTSRGVDRCDTFHSDLDRLVFLSMLAESCRHFGAVCHAWCLMSNHFHIVVEDSTGTLSQILHRLKSGYARFFNDSRITPRSGPLFEGRFRAELIDTRLYFDTAVTYVHRNPLEPAVPLAERAEEYRWSSAAFVCSDVAPEAYFASWLEPFGGIDALTKALPIPSRAAGRGAVRARLEALRSGEWTSRDHVRAGRTADEYREALARRCSDATGATDPEPIDAPLPSISSSVFPLRSRPAFAGFEMSRVLEPVQITCERFIPEVDASEVIRDTTLYLLHRLSCAPIAELARKLKMRVATARRIVSRVGADRLVNPAWGRTLWNVEWSLRWRLGAGPHRF